MKVTRDVVTDLLPLYLAGDASEDTRALVETFFDQDPEFARLVKQKSDQLLPVDIPVTVTKEAEMLTLERTKKLVKRRSMLLSFGILFSLLPLSFSSGPSGVHWLWASSPVGAAVVAILGLLSWVGYFTTKHSLRATGL
jgi:hypothetical protein